MHVDILLLDTYMYTYLPVCKKITYEVIIFAIFF